MQKKLIERYLRILFDIKTSQNVGVKKWQVDNQR